MRRALALAAALMMTLCLTCGALAAVILEVGSKGSNVVKVQQRLIQYGYMTGTADGR